MTKRDKPLVCRHGREVGVEIDPTEVSPGGEYIVHKITMPICDKCLLEAVNEALEDTALRGTGNSPALIAERERGQDGTANEPSLPQCRTPT